MSNDIILSVQAFLIDKLKNHDKLKDIISGVYVYIPENSVMPYIHISRILVKDWSCKTFSGYNISIYLNSYTQEYTIESLGKVQSAIREILHNKAFILDDVLEIRFSNIQNEITRGRRGSSYQLTAQYKILAREI